jgi:hypothetical protein
MGFVVGGGLAAGLLACLAVWLSWRLASSSRVRGVDPDWIRDFSINFYRPMERLLSEDDVIFMKGEPGYRPGMERELRARRVRVFRLYLRRLARDFGRLHLALRLIALHGTQDDPALAKVLIRQRFVFLSALAAVECRLVLYSMGIGTVDVGNLVRSLASADASLKLVLGEPISTAA